MTLAARRDQAALDAIIALAEVIAALPALDQRATQRALARHAYTFARYRFHSLALKLSQLAPEGTP